MTYQWQNKKDTDFMRSVEEEYKIRSGFTEERGFKKRQDYKIYSSHIHKFPLLVLGINPGGESVSNTLDASDTFFENWEQEFIEFRTNSGYRLANLLCQLLAQCLGTSSTDVLRQVPVSNVVFTRRDTSTDITENDKSFSKNSLLKIIEYVNPDTILILGFTAFDILSDYGYFTGAQIEKEIKNAKGHRRVEIAKAYFTVLDKIVNIFTIQHPSRFGIKNSLSHLIPEFKKVGLQQLEDSGYLIELPDIQGYGKYL